MSEKFFKTKKSPNFEIAIKDLDSKKKHTYKTSTGVMIFNANKKDKDNFQGITYIFGDENEIAGLLGVLLSKVEQVLGKERLSFIFKVVSNFDKVISSKFKKVGGLN